MYLTFLLQKVCAAGAEADSGGHRFLFSRAADFDARALSGSYGDLSSYGSSYGASDSESHGGSDCEPVTLAMVLSGWGVPTATDISLAWMVAVLVFGLGHNAIGFLLLLAVVDDGIGLVIIAVAYPDPQSPIQPQWLPLIPLGSLVAYALRRRRVARWEWYILLAMPISWFGFLLSHVHPALALVPIVPFLPDKHFGDKGGGVRAPPTLFELFDLLDLDADGHLSREEVVAAHGLLGLTPAEASQLFSDLDKDGSGELSRAEFSPEEVADSAAASAAVSATGAVGLGGLGGLDDGDVSDGAFGQVELGPVTVPAVPLLQPLPRGGDAQCPAAAAGKGATAVLEAARARIASERAEAEAEAEAARLSLEAASAWDQAVEQTVSGENKIWLYGGFLDDVAPVATVTASGARSRSSTSSTSVATRGTAAVEQQLPAVTAAVKASLEASVKEAASAERPGAPGAESKAAQKTAKGAVGEAGKEHEHEKGDDSARGHAHALVNGLHPALHQFEHDLKLFVDLGNPYIRMRGPQSHFHPKKHCVCLSWHPPVTYGSDISGQPPSAHPLRRVSFSYPAVLRLDLGCGRGRHVLLCLRQCRGEDVRARGHDHQHHRWPGAGQDFWHRRLCARRRPFLRRASPKRGNLSNGLPCAPPSYSPRPHNPVFP